MEKEELLEKIYNLTNESRISDERLELQFKGITKRIESIETLTATMAENLNELKHIQSVVDHLTIQIQQNSKDVKDLKTKITELEQKPIKENAEKWKYIIETISKTIFGILLGFILMKLGFKGGSL